MPGTVSQAVEVYRGDLRDVLSQFPVDYFHAVVTSPPYYGLRSYGPEACMVWGGSQDCQHDWQATPLPVTKMSRQGSTEVVKHPALVKSGHRPTRGAACRLCGAWAGELGQEPYPDMYVQHLVEALRSVRRVLRPDGTLWLNLGDTYSGDKNLMGIPWRVALALQADGWYLRSDIIWDKVNAMPEPARDRPVLAHEYLFLLARQPRYFYDAAAAREPASYEGGTRNARTVWRIPTQSYKGAHFATFPEELVARCLRAGVSEAGCCSVCGAPRRRVYRLRPVPHPNRWGTGPAGQYRGEGYQPSSTLGRGYEAETVGWEPTCHHQADTVPCRVLDPFAGSGTVGVVALRMGLQCVLVEPVSQYVELIERRLEEVAYGSS